LLETEIQGLIKRTYVNENMAEITGHRAIVFTFSLNQHVVARVKKIAHSLTSGEVAITGPINDIIEMKDTANHVATSSCTR